MHGSVVDEKTWWWWSQVDEHARLVSCVGTGQKHARLYKSIYETLFI